MFGVSARSYLCIAALLGCLANTLPIAASAAAFRLEFSASNFAPATTPGGIVPSPFAVVAGSVDYTVDPNADPLIDRSIAPLESLTGVSLSIAGHRYALDEIDFRNFDWFSYVGKFSPGGAGTGVAIDSGTDGWFLGWLRSPPTGSVFAYSVPDQNAGWISTTVDVRILALPEPGTALLAVTGFLMLGFFLRRRHLRRQLRPA